MKRGTMRTNLRACRASYGRFAYGCVASYGFAYCFAYGFAYCFAYRFAYGRFAYYHPDDGTWHLPFDDDDAF